MGHDVENVNIGFALLKPSVSTDALKTQLDKPAVLFVKVIGVSCRLADRSMNVRPQAGPRIALVCFR